jgi:dephospho-CoA kinase
MISGLWETMKRKKRLRTLGLTGGIGMGKSTVAEILRAMGLPVYHADHAVHRALRRGGRAVKPVARLFPEALRQGAIDRKTLGRIVFGHPQRLKQLEKIIHPFVWQEERAFLKQARKKKAPLAILEIPLLFETGGEGRFDAVLCVTAPASVQKARVLSRPGMTVARFKAIAARQMPDRQKRKKADYVIHTGKSIVDTRKQLQRVINIILEA